eukprot:GHVN01054677.1.p1 GENE.GHVN01054677.1~~GHVN01054677.1.p1  ORF type:complete len:163 (+),score=30.95 GHVN01054677.1:191-679(+)
MGGLGVTQPDRNTALLFNTSLSATSHLQSAFTGEIDFEPSTHEGAVASSKQQFRAAKTTADKLAFEEAISKLETSKQRGVKRAAENITSSWLNSVPLAAHHFNLTAQEFRDGLVMRFKLPLSELPSSCDGCGKDADLKHLLNCKVGGLVVHRQNEIRDALGD